MPDRTSPRGKRDHETPEQEPHVRAPSAVYIFAFITARVAEEQPAWPQIAEEQLQRLGPGFSLRTVQGALAVLEGAELIVRREATNERNQRRADRFTLGPAARGLTGTGPEGPPHIHGPPGPTNSEADAATSASRIRGKSTPAQSPSHSTRNGCGVQHPAPQNAKINRSAGVAEPAHEEESEDQQP